MVQNDAARSCAQRGRPDFVCVNNNEVLARCIPDASGRWSAALVKQCDVSRGVRCDESRRDCVANVEFSCTARGLFPDPNRCDTYFSCYELLGQIMLQSVHCGRNLAFNPATNSCDLPRNNPICFTPQYECKFVGQMGPWRSNPNMFYVCVSDAGILFPVIYRCGLRQVFVNDHCVAAR